MIFRSEAQEPTTHDQLVRRVLALLESQSWSVEKEPLLSGNRRPDIIAKSPEGTPFVIEVKAGPAEAHLGSVAQVENYRDSLSAERDLKATGILITATEASPQLSAVADRANVELVQVADAISSGPGVLESRLAELA